MGTPSFDLDRFLPESVDDVADTTYTFTKPDGARSVIIYSAVAWWLNKPSQAAPYTVVAAADGATVRHPYAAGVECPALPCAALSTIKITAQSGNLGNVSALWMF